MNLPGWLRRLLLVWAILGFMVTLAAPLEASPGLCVGPVCGDEITRRSEFPWQLRLRVSDQRGHRERIVVDCRDGSLSPLQGPVERGYALAVARRACRLPGPPPQPWAAATTG
jgi:hypothetical protein